MSTGTRQRSRPRIRLRNEPHASAWGYPCSRAPAPRLRMGLGLSGGVKLTGRWQVPQPLRAQIEKRIAEIKDSAPGSLSDDHSALMVDGGIGYGCFVSPNGDVFIEEYDPGSDEPSQFDRSRRGQIIALVLGKRTLPALAEMLPVRTDDATTCEACSGSGFLTIGQLENFLLCKQCCGLGWISPTVFQEPAT